MAIKPVLRMGAASLFERSEEVTEFNTQTLETLLTDMWDTMAAENGAGIAAPQIGVNLRVVIFGYEQNSRYPTNRRYLKQCSSIQLLPRLVRKWMRAGKVA